MIFTHLIFYLLYIFLNVIISFEIIEEYIKILKTPNFFRSFENCLQFYIITLKFLKNYNLLQTYDYISLILIFVFVLIISFSFN